MVLYPLILAFLAAVVVGPILVFAAPRLVAPRLEVPPELPRPAVLAPLIGGWLASYRPWRTLGFELTIVAVLGGLALRYGSDVRLALAAAYSLLLLLIAYIDLEHRLVLNRLSYPGVVLSLVASAFWPGLGIISGVLGALTGLAIFIALQLLGRGALGMGDTKLATLIGAMRGLPIVLSALFYGVILGGLGAVFYLFVLRRGRREYMPYGPYLAAGAVLSFFLIPK
jgi:leader peptidase (prepilin peptidase)/N-methyltransferase